MGLRLASRSSPRPLCVVCLCSASSAFNRKNFDTIFFGLGFVCLLILSWASWSHPEKTRKKSLNYFPSSSYSSAAAAASAASRRFLSRWIQSNARVVSLPIWFRSDFLLCTNYIIVQHEQWQRETMNCEQRTEPHTLSPCGQYLQFTMTIVRCVETDSISKRPCRRQHREESQKTIKLLIVVSLRLNGTDSSPHSFESSADFSFGRAGAEKKIIFEFFAQRHLSLTRDDVWKFPIIQ